MYRFMVHCYLANCIGTCIGTCGHGSIGTLPMVPTSFPAKARAEILRRTQDLGVPTVTCPWLRVVGRKVFGGCFF